MDVLPKPLTGSVLALDVGSKRIGVAVATSQARLPQPLVTLAWDTGFFTALERIMATEQVSQLVVGLPRGLEGQHTDQTRAVETFVTELGQHVDIPIQVQDEALTSRQAEAELEARGRPYAPGDIDALAATYILADWLAEQPQLTRVKKGDT